MSPAGQDLDQPQPRLATGEIRPVPGLGPGPVRVYSLKDRDNVLLHCTLMSTRPGQAARPAQGSFSN